MDNLENKRRNASATATAVITAFAYFDSFPVPNVLVHELHSLFSTDPLAFSEIVHVELVDSASLLEDTEFGGKGCFECIHWLVTFSKDR